MEILTRQYALKTGDMKSVTEVRVLSIVKLDRPKTSEPATRESGPLPKGCGGISRRS